MSYHPYGDDGQEGSSLKVTVGKADIVEPPAVGIATIVEPTPFVPAVADIEEKDPQGAFLTTKKDDEDSDSSSSSSSSSLEPQSDSSPEKDKEKPNRHKMVPGVRNPWVLS